VTISLPGEHKDYPAAPDFDRLAPIYRWMEWLTFGPFLQRCRCSFLPNLGSRSRGLILGDGDGRFIARLLESNPTIRIDAVDASQAMLRQLAARANTHQVLIHKADVRKFKPPQSRYDLIATHFFLDCLSTAEVRDLASKLRDHSRPDTLWLVSEFALPQNSFRRIIARALISALYMAFGLLTNLHTHELPNHHQALADSGWNLVDRHQYLGGLLVSELWLLGSNLPAETRSENSSNRIAI